MENTFSFCLRSRQRNVPRTIELRFKIASQWKAENVKFKKKCVFVMKLIFTFKWWKPVPNLNRFILKGHKQQHCGLYFSLYLSHCQGYGISHGCLGEHDKIGMYIVVDNCRINHSRFVVDTINIDINLCLCYLNLLLNPIKECWKIFREIRWKRKTNSHLGLLKTVKR